MESSATEQNSIEAAVQAFQHGYQPVPIRNGSKKPFGSAWTQLRWSSEAEIRASFEQYANNGASGVGLLLGAPSGGLVDVDLDHPKSLKLRTTLLPRTPMMSGRPGKMRSHYWYRVTTNLPATRQYKMPDKSMIVELRSTGGQTLIPPSIWTNVDNPSHTEPYVWALDPWGGKRGPAEIDGKVLHVQVALLALGVVLIDAWPKRGSRHEAFLALAGGLLRQREGVHRYWERNLPTLIETIADVTHDDDASTRVSEVMGTTLSRLREGGKAVGFPHLAEIIGTDNAELARRYAKDIEALAGYVGNPIERIDAETGEVYGDNEPLSSPEDGGPPIEIGSDSPLNSTLDPENRNPLEERINTWAEVKLEAYLNGEVSAPKPSVLARKDGVHLFYFGKVNSLYGSSESGKTFLSLATCVQEMGKDTRILYIDLEDDPENTVSRLRALGGADDDVLRLFKYIRPEGPIAAMQRGRYGVNITSDGRAGAEAFKELIDAHDPELIVVDGMTALYGLHGLDTNDASSTDVITTWLKKLGRNGRTTVIVIDHTGKNAGTGSSPIGAHHKIAMVQGAALRVDVLKRPIPGDVGTLQLVVFKDRPGAVRKHSSKNGSEQVAGIVTIDSTKGNGDDFIELWIDPPDPNLVVADDTQSHRDAMDKITKAQASLDDVLALFKDDPTIKLSTADVCSMLRLGTNTVYEIWKLLKASGRIQMEGDTKYRRYFLRVDEAIE